MPGYLLTEQDRRLIQTLLNAERGRTTHTGKPGPDRPWLTPEVYIALIPEDGIPGLDVVTGTVAPVISYARCAIYRILEDGTGSPQEYYLGDSGYERAVFNLSTVEAAGGLYVLVHRTKQGKFVIGSGSSVEGETFTQDVPAGCPEIENGNLTQKMKRWTVENGLIVSRESIPSCSTYVCCDTGTGTATSSSTGSTEDCLLLDETPSCFRVRVNGVPGITGPFDLRRGCADNYGGCSWTTVKDVGDYGCEIAQIRIDFLDGPDRVNIEFNSYPVGSPCFHGSNKATFTKTFASIPLDTDTELEDIPLSSQTAGACDWSGGTIDLEAIPADQCISDDDSGGGTGGGGGAAEDPCTHCSGTTPATKTINLSGIIQLGGNPCSAAVLNALSIEVDQHDTESCKWELTGIEDGPCGLESIYYTMDPFQWLVSLSFNGGGHTVQFRLAGGGTHDCSAQRVLTFDAEYTGGGAVADFSAATATVD